MTVPHSLKSQFVTSSWGGLRRATPCAFTEQGIAMRSSVLNSPRAIRVNSGDAIIQPDSAWPPVQSSGKSKTSWMAPATLRRRADESRVSGPWIRRRLSMARSWSMSRSEACRNRPEAATRMRRGSASSTRFVVSGMMSVEGWSASSRAWD